jgi:hypothetical protein
MDTENFRSPPCLQPGRSLSRVAWIELASCILVSAIVLGAALIRAPSHASAHTTCLTTRWVERQSADDYQADGHGTYHLQNQLWALVDSYWTWEYCGSEFAKSLLWVPYGASITDWCVALSGTGGATACAQSTTGGGGPYMLQTDPVSQSCGYVAAGAFNNDDPWNLVALTGAYPYGCAH